MRERSQRKLGLFAVCVLASAAAGCAPDMADQPRYDALEPSSFFENGMSARPKVEGTIARGQLQLNELFYQGHADGKLARTIPAEVNEALLERGRQRFNIYCSQCHDRTGSGQGMVVKRGFPAPPTYHSERLRAAPVGYFFDVITNGLGRMAEHGSMVTPEDRWAIVAYIRALQLSQYAKESQLSSEDLQKLGGEES